MITKTLLDTTINKAYNYINETKKIPGQSFNKFFKEINWIIKNTNTNTTKELKEFFNDIDKKNIIIFSPNHDKLDAMEEVKDKVIFPFDEIFLEYPLVHYVQRDYEQDIIFRFTNGFLLKKIKGVENDSDMICISSIWIDYGSNKDNINEEGIKPMTILLPYNQLNHDIEYNKDEMSKEDLDTINVVRNNLRKLCKLIQNKEYKEYYKFECNEIIKKDIVFYHDVKSHKRHFWQDSGRFKIPLMTKEELFEKGYGIDECVFRGYELRKDVPYKIIGSYKVGDINQKEDNKIINLLKKRIFKNEEKLGFILSKIFTEEIIKRHDRRIIGPFELDYYIHNLKLAFEYDGEQHYNRNICENVFKSNFDEQRNRDLKKNAICRHKNIKLIRIKYDEQLTISNIKSILKSNGVNI